jgi:heat shock protein HslJ
LGQESAVQSRLILALVAAVAACAPAAPSELEGAWLVQQIAGASLNADERIYFSVDGETMRGFTGCNEFTASVTQFSETVSISNVNEIDAACPSEAAATNEARFLGVLPSVTRFARHGASLHLLGDRSLPDALVIARTDNFAEPTE